MAYQSKSLSALAYANGFTMWHYRTEDSAADVDTTGYFSPAVKMMRVGDFILLNAGIAATPAHGIMVVVSNDGTSVDVTNATAVGTVDSD